MKNYVIVVNEKEEYYIGQCENMWEALDKFKLAHPEIDDDNNDITVSVRNNK